MSHPQDSQDSQDELVDMTLEYYFWAVSVCRGEARNPLFASEKLPPWQARQQPLKWDGWIDESWLMMILCVWQVIAVLETIHIYSPSNMDD